MVPPHNVQSHSTFFVAEAEPALKPAPLTVASARIAGVYASITADMLRLQMETETACGAPCTLDLRAASAFRNGHLAGAISVSSSTILQRRLDKGMLTVADLLADEDKASYVSSSRRTLVVVYDHCSPAHSASASIQSMLRALQREDCNAVFLAGGFQQFGQTFPHLVRVNAASARPLSLSLPSRGLAPVRLSVAAPSSAAPTSTTTFRLDTNTSTSIPSAEPSGADANLAAQANPATAVYPNVFVGGKADAQNRSFLASNNIRYVLNVTTDCRNFFQQEPEFVYHNIHIRDSWHQNIQTHFQEAFDFIDLALSQHSAVLVHCMAGISRSATLVIAYIMQKTQQDMHTVYNKVKAARPCISPNLDFMGHLLSFERTLCAQQQQQAEQDDTKGSSMFVDQPLNNAKHTTTATTGGTTGETTGATTTPPTLAGDVYMKGKESERSPQDVAEASNYVARQPAFFSSAAVHPVFSNAPTAPPKGGIPMYTAAAASAAHAAQAASASAAMGFWQPSLPSPMCMPQPPPMFSVGAPMMLSAPSVAVSSS